MSLSTGVKDLFLPVRQVDTDLMSLPPAMTETSDLFQPRFFCNVRLYCGSFFVKSNATSIKWTMSSWNFYTASQWTLQVSGLSDSKEAFPQATWLQRKEIWPQKNMPCSKGICADPALRCSNIPVQRDEPPAFFFHVSESITAFTHKLYMLCFCFWQQITRDGQVNYGQDCQLWRRRSWNWEQRWHVKSVQLGLALHRNW